MMISFIIEDEQGRQQLLEIPDDNGFSLMEILRAAGCPIAATCGGMALCATCLVKVTAGHEHLPPPNEAENDLLDTLPLGRGHFRLSCQLRVERTLNGCTIRPYPMF